MTERTRRNIGDGLEREDRMVRAEASSQKENRGGCHDVRESRKRAKNWLRCVRKRVSVFKPVRNRAESLTQISRWQKARKLRPRMDDCRRVMEEIRTLFKELKSRLQKKTEDDTRKLLERCVDEFHRSVAATLNVSLGLLKEVLSSERTHYRKRRWMAPQHQILKGHLKNIGFTRQEWDMSILFTKNTLSIFSRIGNIEDSECERLQRKANSVLSQYPAKEYHMLRKVFRYQQHTFVRIYDVEKMMSLGLFSQGSQD